MVGAVQLRGEADHQRVAEGPGLRPEGTDIFDTEPGLLKNLPVHRVLRGLSDLNEAGDQCLSAVVAGVSRIACEQKLVPVGHRDDDGGRDLRIFDESAVLADHGALYLRMNHGRAAAPAVLSAVIKAPELRRRDGGEGLVLWREAPELRSGHKAIALREQTSGDRRAGNQKVELFVDCKEVARLYRERRKIDSRGSEIGKAGKPLGLPLFFHQYALISADHQ